MLQTLSYHGERKAASLSLFLILSPKSHGYFHITHGNPYNAIQYFISLIASPNSLQGPWLCLPSASCAHVYSSTHRLMNWVSGCAPSTPSCTGRSSTSDNNAGNTNTSKHDDRTYCIPGNVPGTIHKTTDLASMTAPWDTYEFFSSFADENTERLGRFSKVTQLVRSRLRLKPWQSGSRVYTLKHHTLLPLYLVTW